MENALTKNYLLGPVDTDSISFCKPDFSPFSKEEQDSLLKEINALLPELIQYDHDGYFPKVICLKAKNYILYDGSKVKIKGSALKATTKCPALKEFIKRIIDYMVYNDNIIDNDLISLYNQYVKEIMNVKDISRWSARKTISDKVLESDRTNEAKLRTAIEGSEIVEGDRCHVYYKSDNSLSLVQNFDGDYNKDRLLQNLYDTAYTFETVLDCDKLFKNYKLKKNKKDLEELLKC